MAFATDTQANFVDIDVSTLAWVLLGVIIGKEFGTIDISTIDEIIMFNLPGPTGIHCFRSRVGGKRLVRPLPTTDYGTVAKQALAVIDVWFFESLANQLFQ